MTSKTLREKFLDYFRGKGHRIFPSISLVPPDPTLLFTSAGMVQFKSMFLKKDKNCTRAVSSQKCFRTSDIEKVGYTIRHLTFFEMLGNFSFGDYFKKDAIEWGWDFLVKELGLPEGRMYASVYEEDDEAYELWTKILHRGRIVKLGKKDNFWEMGESGPCGPCSEIIMDMGRDAGCGKKDCKPGCDCNRWLEIWNLVFTQFNKDDKGNLSPLPQKNIDTGMGLERLLMVVNGEKDCFDTDLMKPIIDYVCRTYDVSYGKNEKEDISLRIIADHARGVTFLGADGILPSNEGRGYILRKILRRAVCRGISLNIDKPFLYRIIGQVVSTLKDVYPDLAGLMEHIANLTKMEEEQFQETLKTGTQKLKELINEKRARNETIISGKEVFFFYDTYGLPPEVSADIAIESGFLVEKEGFEDEMSKQKERARQAWKGSGKEDIGFYERVERKNGKNIFTGYEVTETDSIVKCLIKNGKEQVKEFSNKGEKINIILTETPFYAEEGGQVGDKGRIFKDKDMEVEIIDTKTPVPGLIIHKGKLLKGKIKVGDNVKAIIDVERRNDIRRNHTATHLLHAVLRQVLGKHIRQSGSLVSDERLRFDFTHPHRIENHDLDRIEELVNDAIMKNLPVNTSQTALTKAKDMGAMALFGEKYGDTVRMISVGTDDSRFSLELCGGTHCKSTGEIGFFKVTGENGIASGIRRIEAVTGKNAWRYVKDQEEKLGEIEGLLKVPLSNVTERVSGLIQSNKELAKQASALKIGGSKETEDDLIKKTRTVNGIKIISAEMNGMDRNSMRMFADRLKDRLRSGIIILGSIIDGKPAFITMVTKDLVEKGYRADNIVKHIAVVTGGTGGGRADMAQAGGREVSKMEKALAEAEKIIQGSKDDIYP